MKPKQKQKPVFSIRLSDENRHWLHRNGKPLAEQLRADLDLVRAILRAAKNKKLRRLPLETAIAMLEGGES